MVLSRGGSRTFERKGGGGGTTSAEGASFVGFVACQSLHSVCTGRLFVLVLGKRFFCLNVYWRDLKLIILYFYFINCFKDA